MTIKAACLDVCGLPFVLFVFQDCINGIKSPLCLLHLLQDRHNHNKKNLKSGEDTHTRNGMESNDR